MQNEIRFANGVAQTGFSEATDAAIDILERGGNAVDGAIAALLALCVRGIGTTRLGGEAAALLFNANTGAVVSLAGQGAAPMNPAAIDWYLKPNVPGRGIRAAAVPAMLDLCVQALKRYGTLTFAEVSRAAIDELDKCENDWYFDTGSQQRVCGLSGKPYSEEIEPLEFGGRSWHTDLSQTFSILVVC